VRPFLALAVVVVVVVDSRHVDLGNPFDGPYAVERAAACPDCHSYTDGVERRPDWPGPGHGRLQLPLELLALPRVDCLVASSTVHLMVMSQAVSVAMIGSLVAAAAVAVLLMGHSVVVAVAELVVVAVLPLQQPLRPPLVAAVVVAAVGD
jgi:hypothetical protein